MLGIYGQHSLGNRVSRQEYNDFLLQRMHKQVQNGKLNTEREAQIQVTAEYVRSGRALKIDIIRNFIRNSNRVVESVSVIEDGQPIRIDLENRQAWIEDLFPSNQAQLCFFDAEQLETMSNLDHEGHVLGGLIRRYLGIDIIDKLHYDLEAYSLKQGGLGNVQRLSTAVVQLQSELDHIASLVESERNFEEGIAEREASIRNELLLLERRLNSEGGDFARRRPELQKRLSELEQETKHAEAAIRDECAGLLPFALCPELCALLGKSLESEAKTLQKRAASEFWSQHIYEIERTLAGDALWSGIAISGNDRRDFVHRLMPALNLEDTSDIGASKSVIHNISETDQIKIRQLIAQSNGAFLHQVIGAGKHLSDLTKERRAINSELESVPDADALVHIFSAIQDLQKNLFRTQRERAQILEGLGSLRYQMEEKARLKTRAVEEFEAAQACDVRLRLVTQSKQVLRGYKVALLRARLHHLEHALVKCFNDLCRKESLLTNVAIDEDTFTLVLEDAQGTPFRLQSLSAGERQLFAYALLWALREVTGQSLPLVIDTPVARLDEIHRDRVLRLLFPNISRQVLVFATSAELDAAAIEQVSGETSRVYYLDYTPELHATSATMFDPADGATDTPLGLAVRG
jgi:DNA sulfur modification protein DndD